MVTSPDRRLSALVLLEPDSIDAVARRVGDKGSIGDAVDAASPPAAQVDAVPEAPCDFEIRIVRARASASSLEHVARAPWCADYLASAIAEHAEHVAIAVAPGVRPVAAATWLSARVHAVVRTYAAAVVVWGETHAIPAGLFAERCEAYRCAPPEERELPVELWVYPGLTQRDRAVSARTRGLASLDRPEVELAPVLADVEDARQFVLELALHLVESEPHAWPIDGAVAGELGGVELVVRRTDGLARLEPIPGGAPRTRPAR